MRATTLGSLTATLTGGLDGQGGGDGPIVILMHGYGATGHDLVPLGQSLDVPASVRFVFPQAPLELGIYPGARAWWHIDLERLHRSLSEGRVDQAIEHEPQGLATAHQQVMELIEQLRKENPASPIAIGGFSQGAILAADIAFQTQTSLSGLVLLSTTIVNESRWLSGMRARLQMPVFQSHGTMDPILPFAIAERLHNHLNQSGLKTNWVPFHGGHTITDVVLDRLGHFIQRTTIYSTVETN